MPDHSKHELYGLEVVSIWVYNFIFFRKHFSDGLLASKAADCLIVGSIFFSLLLCETKEVDFLKGEYKIKKKSFSVLGLHMGPKAQT